MKPPCAIVARLVLVAILSWALTGRVGAQAVTILQGFQNFVSNNGDTNPLQVQTGLIQGSDGYLYGTTSTGTGGGLFKISPQGDLTNLFGANGMVTTFVEGTDHDFYATANTGNGGTVFKETPQGQFTSLYSFPQFVFGTNSNTFLGTPLAGLAQGTDGNFYGTTSGAYQPFVGFGQPLYSGGGIVYKITPQGTLTVLHTFGDGSVTNDGSDPSASLIQGSDGNFYGTTQYGGTGQNTLDPTFTGAGTVFKMTPQGVVTILHSFNGGSVSNDGQNPTAALIQSTDGNFYGTTTNGGLAEQGTIFKMTPQGAVTILHSFVDGSVSNDGSEPVGGLIHAADGNFYGTTQYGGRGGGGVIYEITPQGRYTILHHFQDGTVLSDGFISQCTLVQGSDGNLYGTTFLGGPFYQPPLFPGQFSTGGAVFKVTLDLPALTSATFVSGNVGVPFSYKAVATQAVTSIIATGLPDGLSIDSNTGLISGTPTTEGITIVTLTMTNAFGSNTSSLTFNIGALPVPTVTSILTGYAATNIQFSYTITGSNGATSFTASGLPSGLTVESSTGIISGNPTVSGTFPVSLTATNGAGTSATATLSLQVKAGAPTLSQEYVLLHLFNDGTVASDAQNPSIIFQGFDGTLFGAAQAGGTATDGAVFNITTQGMNSVLASLGPNPASQSTAQRSAESLVQGSDGNFYGTVANVGASTGGYFYRATALGDVTILHHFGDGTVAKDGEAPMPGLIQGLDGNFYGMTEFGGSASEGCIYKINAQGSVTILHSFGDNSVANDGQNPISGLIQGIDGNFYGMTFGGGSTSANAGVIFQMTPLGHVTILHKFGDGTVTNDGEQPGAALLQGDDGNFYGTTQVGGSFEAGCVFRITPLGVVTILHSFGDGTVPNDGDSPQSPLIEGYDGNFYGTTSLGGSAGQGTIFSITSAGGVVILHNFGDGSVANDGAFPTSVCQGLDGNFYGTTEAGGSGTGFGTVFAILAGQKPTNRPVFTGSAFAASAINTPFFYTPKAEFGASGSGTINTGSAIQASLVSPSTIHKNFTQTNWELDQGTTPGTMLPNFLTFDPTSGTISGTPVESGIFTVTMIPINAIGKGASQTITLFIDVPPIITSPGTAGGSMLTPFNYSITAQALPSAFGATDLPAWLSVDMASGILSGTPPTGGTFVFNTIAENYAGASTQKVVLTVTGNSPGAPQITSATAVNATAGIQLNYQIAANTATSYSALILPTGLTCNPTTGLISGTPTTAGTFSVPITATNGSGTTASEVTFTIMPVGSPVLASTLTAQAYNGIFFSYNIPVTGVVSLFNAIGLPDGLSLDPLSGNISGTPTSSGTTPVQIFAMNGNGTATASLNLIVSTATPQTYADWATIHSPVGGESAMPDHDGVPNLLKFLYDIDPSRPLSGADVNALPGLYQDTVTTPGMSYLTLTYRQFVLASDVTVKVETSTDLKTWTLVDPPDISQQIGNDPVTGDPIMEIGVLSNGGSKQFIRLQVTSP